MALPAPTPSGWVVISVRLVHEMPLSAAFNVVLGCMPRSGECHHVLRVDAEFVFAVMVNLMALRYRSDEQFVGMAMRQDRAPISTTHAKTAVSIMAKPSGCPDPALTFSLLDLRPEAIMRSSHHPKGYLKDRTSA